MGGPNVFPSSIYQYTPDITIETLCLCFSVRTRMLSLWDHHFLVPEYGSVPLQYRVLSASYECNRQGA